MTAVFRTWEVGSSSIPRLLTKLWVVVLVSCTAHGRGLDPGVPAPEFVEIVKSNLEISASTTPWIHVRGLPRPINSNPAEILKHREAVRFLKNQRFQLVAAVRTHPSMWKSSVRPGSGKRFPLDLREAYSLGISYARHYGDLIEWFEIENEPDIDFVAENPETYAAYFKAFALGLRSVDSASLGDAGIQLERSKPKPIRLHLHRRFYPRRAIETAATDRKNEQIRVLNAPLALPPGPYFEHLLDQDILSYTDGFNYHYYGYDEDFTGVYNQFKNAIDLRVGEFESQNNPRPLGLMRSPSIPPSISAIPTHNELPVFLSEYGYGLLSQQAANSQEGRERQRRWYASVQNQIESLPITGAMAFRLTPMLELGHNEFGLLEEVSTKSYNLYYPLRSRGTWKPRIMRRSGFKRRVMNVKPASAWHELQTRPIENPNDRPSGWNVSIPRASPVILDFQPDESLVQSKSHRGYFVTGFSNSRGTSAPGIAHIYNFSRNVIEGEIWQSDFGGWQSRGLLTLAPGERKLIPVSFELSPRNGEAVRAIICFAPIANPLISPSHSASVWSSNFQLPPLKLTPQSPIIQQSPQSLGNLRARLDQPTASEEPQLVPTDSWLHTKGTSLEFLPDGRGIKVTVSALPEPLRPATLEFPLRPGLNLDPNFLLNVEHRQISGFDQSKRMPSMMEFGFRSRDGVHFTVWPRVFSSDVRKEYWQQLANFSPMFFSRTNGPIDPLDHDLITFVVTFRPQKTPAIYELSIPTIRPPNRSPVRHPLTPQLE